jgi:hypothetical protein
MNNESYIKADEEEIEIKPFIMLSCKQEESFI